MSKWRVLLVSVLALTTLFVVGGPAGAQTVSEIQADTDALIDDAFAEANAELDEDLVSFDDDFTVTVDDDFFDDFDD